MASSIVDAAKIRIQKLIYEKDKFAKEADEAYKNKDHKLEMELQKEIDSRNLEISQLESRIIDIEYPDLDIEKEIKKRRKEHNWEHSERCHKCQMKRSSTFLWKVQGVRENYNHGFKSEAVKILETMKCKR